MKKTLFVTLALAALLLYGMPGVADAGPVTASGKASARVRYPISLEEMDYLDFGEFSGEGTITIHEDDSPPTVTGSMEVMGYPPHRGEIKVMGDDDGYIRASITPSHLKLTGMHGTPPPVLYADIYINQGAHLEGPGDHDEAMLYVHGVLTATWGTPAGKYMGSFEVTCDYE